MKKLYAAITLSVLTLSTAHAGIGSPPGPADFNLDAITQTMTFQPIGGKTNQNATSTNTTIVFKATTAKTSFDSTDMLNVLSNSFNTTFAAGSQIGMNLNELVVLDSTGTNIIFQPVGVVSFQFDEEMTSGTLTEILTQNSSGTHESGNASATVTISATMTYDDTLKTTGDGTHTKFAFKGLLVMSGNQNLKNNTGKTTIQFQGTGGGPVRGIPTILNGTITVKIPRPLDI